VFGIISSLSSLSLSLSLGGGGVFGGGSMVVFIIVVSDRCRVLSCGRLK